MYSPVLGRFLQTDPIGYADGMNMYAYVGNDPVNFVDPSGMEGNVILAIGNTPCRGDSFAWFCETLINSFTGSWLNQALLDLGIILVTASTGGEEPQSEPPCPTGSRVNLGGGASATGFLGIVGASVGLGGGVSVPTASLPFVGDGSFRGTQFSGSGSITPLAGLGLFAGVGPNYSLGGSNGAAGRVSRSVTPVIQLGAGDGGGVEVTSDLNSPLSLSGAMGRIAAGAYGAIGARFEGRVSTDPIGCR